MLYVKDGKVKDSSEIIVIVGKFQIINPSEEQILADGWVPYTPPPIDEQLILKGKTENKIRNMFFKSNISSEINTYGLTNNEALSVKEYFPNWKEGIEIKQGERYQDDDLLWECVKDHTSQINWKPSIDTSSLWKIINIEHNGTIDDPIPFVPPMEIFANKYYIQNEIVYKCVRNSEIPITQAIAEIVGIYVELA